MNYDKSCKLLIIGDSTVGKTSVLISYVADTFNTQYMATVGVDYFTKDETFGNKIVRVKIWDTAGQERYKSLTYAFFRNADAIILVYDVSNQESFNNLKYWIQSIKSNLGENNSINKIILGNKIDLERNVTKEEAQKFANEVDIDYFECSAKTKTGVNEAMRFLVQKVMRDSINPSDHDSVRLTKLLNKQEKSCKC